MRQNTNEMKNPFINAIKSLEKTYHEKIPISKHMDIKVLDYDGSKLTLCAPLSNNINHQNSAFGGSLFSLAALAGWGLLQLKLDEEKLDCNTVIAGGEVSYQAPVFNDFTCECNLSNQSFLQTIEKLENKNKASLELESQILCNGISSMKFKGRYVIVPRAIAPH